MVLLVNIKLRDYIPMQLSDLLILEIYNHDHKSLFL